MINSIYKIIWYAMVSLWHFVKIIGAIIILIILIFIIFAPPLLLVEAIEQDRFIIPYIIIFTLWLAAIGWFIKHE